eukprot:scaffold3920_cov262-Pinguiococcus_pyrenoidosus.AAC.9
MRPASSASSQQRERQRYGGGGGGMGKALVRGSCAHPGMLWPRLTDVGRRFFGNDCAHFKQKDGLLESLAQLLEAEDRYCGHKSLGRQVGKQKHGCRGASFGAFYGSAT